MKGLNPVRLTLSTVGLVFISLLAVGCGSSTSSSSSSTDPSGSSSGTTPKAAALVYAINDYTSVELEGIEAKLEKVGGSLHALSANFDPQEQLAQCQDAITSQRYNVLLVDPVDSPSAVPCAVQAGEEGIKVIAFENPIGPSRTEVDPQLPEVQGSVVVNPLDDAEGTFQLVEEACKGNPHCQWIIEIGTSTSPFDSTKLKYLEEQDEKASNIEIAEVIEGNYDPSETTKKAPDALAAHPDANVFTFESDTNALAAVPAVEAAGLQNQVKIIGDGGSRAGVKAIEDGKMFGSIASWALTTGEVAGEMALEALDGKVKTPGVNEAKFGETLLDQPFELTKATVGEYTPQWGAK